MISGGANLTTVLWVSFESTPNSINSSQILRPVLMEAPQYYAIKLLFVITLERRNPRFY